LRHYTGKEQEYREKLPCGINFERPSDIT